MKSSTLKPILLMLAFGLPCTMVQTGQAQQTNDSKIEVDAKKEAAAQEESEPIDMNLWMRLRKDRDGNFVAMETSITRYVTKNSDGQKVTVDLIGVVHIGERAYYEKLNEQFENYDSLLYELVAPEGTVIPKGGRGGGGGMNPVAFLQKSMQAVLGLEFQLEHIDYTAENFVHADMTPEEFSASMKENEESMFKMALRAVGQSIAMQSKGQAGGASSTDTELLMALISGEDREVTIRRIMAEQMMDMESGMVIFQGKDGSTIIDHRNDKAIEVLMEQIDAGKTHLGVFYGAGHLPDMDKILTEDKKMKRGGQTWLKAWNLKEE